MLLNALLHLENTIANFELNFWNAIKTIDIYYHLSISVCFISSISTIFLKESFTN